MTLNDVYLISQIIAVVLVAPTIIYLALQVRQNTAQLRAVARNQFLEATGQLNALGAGSKQVASMYRRGLADLASLDDDEQMQFFGFVGHFFQIYSVMFELHQDGLLPDSQWHAAKKDMLALLDTKGGMTLWESFGREGLSPPFVSYIDKLRAEDGRSFHIPGS